MIATDIDKRVSLAMAVRRYLQATDRFHQASTEFERACGEVRQQAAREGRYVIEIDYRHWLLEIDAQGNFELEEIELL
jgi:hypothetical protein